MNNAIQNRSLIALDYGRRRVGVAGCKGDHRIAFGITTLQIRDSNDLIAQLLPLLRERSVTEVVIGFPVTLGDKPGTLSKEVLALAGKLKTHGYHVHLVDEALSSLRASEMLRQRGKRTRKEDIDRSSAALILQEYLDGTLPPLDLRDFTPPSVTE